MRNPTNSDFDVVGQSQNGYQVNTLAEDSNSAKFNIDLENVMLEIINAQSKQIRLNILSMKMVQSLARAW